MVKHYLKNGPLITIATLLMLALLMLITLPYFHQSETVFVTVSVLIPTAFLIALVMVILKTGREIDERETARHTNTH